MQHPSQSTSKGNQNTDSYQWVVVDGSDCASATYSEAIQFPNNKQADLEIKLEENTGTGDINKTLCVTGSNKDTTSEPATHSWKQSPPQTEETPAVTPSKTAPPQTEREQPATTPTVKPSETATQTEREQPATTPTVTPTGS